MPAFNNTLILSKLQELFYHKIFNQYKDLSEDEVLSCLEITPSTNLKFGHYQCNSALKLSKIVKDNPRSVATKLLLEDSMIAKLDVAGPGFINITLSNAYLEKTLKEINFDSRLGIKRTSSPQKIIVEFSSPNTAKELHVGHLRSTIIGDSLARLFEFLGHDVLRLNHIGDWGTPFGMLICFLKEFHPHILSGKEKTDLSHLAQWYKDARKLFDENEDFKKRSQLEVVKLQAREADAMKAWNIICDISRATIAQIYDLLDINILERGESFYDPYLKDVVKHFEEKKLIQDSDGAKCIFLDGFETKEGNPLPLIIQKSDGGFNYATTDLAAINHRTCKEKATKILNVVDAGQSLHFQMVFKAAQIAHLYDPKKVQITHVPFGLVLGEDGKKYKTRSGKSERLMDLLTNGVKKAEEILKDRDPNQDEAERQQTAQTLGINALKYADLSSLRTKDYVFSYDKMLQFEGNTAAFLLYAYVRGKSIQSKTEITSEELKNSSIELKVDSEVYLALQILQLGEILEGITESLLPNRLCDYLYQLSVKFHAFFRDCKVIGSDDEKSRLILCQLTQKTFEIGFSILGLKTVDRM